MSDNPRQKEIAQRFLELWQDEITSFASDTDTETVMQTLLEHQMASFSMMHKTFLTLLNLPQLYSPPNEKPESADGHSVRGDTPKTNASNANHDITKPTEQTSGSRQKARDSEKPAGSPPFVSSSRHGGRNMDELADRLAALEAKLADLESRKSGTGQTTSRRSSQNSKPRRNSRKTSGAD